MRLELLHTLPSDEDFRRQWNALVLAMEQPEVFYTWEWAKAVDAAYGAGITLRVITAYRDGSLIGIAALMSRAESPQRVAFLCAATADYCDFVSRPEDRERFVRAVFQKLRQDGIEFADLASIPSDSISVKSLAAAARDAGLHIFSRPAYSCAQLVFRSEQDRVDAARSARKQYRRKLNALSSHGSVTLRHTNSWEQSAAESPAFARAHVGRFLANGVISNLVSGKRRRFLQELGALLAQQGWLAMSTVRLRDEAVAWNFGASFAGKWFWYQPAFEMKLQDAGPGTCLITDIIGKASGDCSIHTVDLGLGDEEYKKRYANSARKTLNFVAARSRTALARELIRYRAATLVKRWSALEKSLRALLARTTTLRHPAGLKRGFQRLKDAFFGRTEVIFFEYPPGTRSSPPGILFQPLSLDLLAAAAIEYENDPDTLQYLLRSAKRISSGEQTGYAWLSEQGVPVHFCWTAPFEDFWVSELGRRVDPPGSTSRILFDCWTPTVLRGHGYYGRCISAVAGLLAQQGLRPWIFSAASNERSIRAIASTQFQRRFSIVRRMRFWFSRNEVVENGTPGYAVPGLATR